MRKTLRNDNKYRNVLFVAGLSPWRRPGMLLMLLLAEGSAAASPLRHRSSRIHYYHTHTLQALSNYNYRL